MELNISRMTQDEVKEVVQMLVFLINKTQDGLNILQERVLSLEMEINSINQKLMV